MDSFRITIPRLSSLSVIAVLFALTLVFGSCVLDLDSAEQSRKASVFVTIPGASTTATSPSAGDDSAARALATEPGFLYVQTGLTAQTARLYGPYPATPGATVTIDEMPAATYPAIALFFLSEIPASPVTPVIPTEPTLEAMRLAVQEALSPYPEICSASSVGLVENFAVQRGERNTLTATLVPTTTTTFSASGNSGVSVEFSESRRVGRFVKLTDVRTLFPTTSASPMNLVWLVLNDSSSTIRVSGVSLFSSSGVFLGRDATEIELAPGSYHSFPFLWSGDDAYYVYLDAIGGKISLFASAADSGPVMNGALQILDQSSGNASYTNEMTVDLAIPYGFTVSGISAITLAGDASFAAGSTVDGTSVASWTPTTLTLLSPVRGTGTLAVRGVALAAGEGSKTASVSLMDASGRVQTVSDATQSTYHAASTVLDTIPSGSPSFSAPNCSQYMNTFYMPNSPSLVTCYSSDDNGDGDDDEEDGSGVVGYSFDPAGPAAWESTFTVTTGQTVTIYAIDRAGNVSLPFTVNVLQDNTAPALVSIGVGSTSSDLRVDFSNELGGSGIGNCILAYTMTYSTQQTSGIGAMSYQEVGKLWGGSYIETWHLPTAVTFEYLYIKYVIPDNCGNKLVGYVERHYDGTAYTYTQVSP